MQGFGTEYTCPNDHIYHCPVFFNAHSVYLDYPFVGFEMPSSITLKENIRQTQFCEHSR